MSPFTWALLTAVTWGLVPLIEKMGLLKVDPLVGIFYRCFGVMIGIIVLFAVKAPAIKQSFTDLHPGMLYLALGGFLASVVGQIFFYHALKTGDASRVVPLAGAYPLISFILGVVLLGEKVTLSKAGGMAFIIMGVMLLK